MFYLVEDDTNIRQLILYTLNSYGWETCGFETPSAFWAAMKKERPRLILLDIMLPEEDGISILKKLRKDPATAHTPILLLTAKASEYDKVLGLDSGADDYVTKPFGMMELIARIKALLRRTEDRNSKNELLVYGGLQLDVEGHTVFANGEAITVTRKEFDLLCLLMQNPGVVFDREQLLERIWGYGFDGENRTVDVHIRTLRHKLGECGCCIETVRGIGYKLGGHTA